MTDTYTPVLPHDVVTDIISDARLRALPLHDLCRAIERAAIEAYQRQQWISVDDRLPGMWPGDWFSARVLAVWATTNPDEEPGGIETSVFDGRHWQGANGSMDYHGCRSVTHWQPLPPPPETI